MKRLKYVPLILFFVILSLTVGFSAFNKNLMIKDLGAQIRIVKDIRITGIIPNGSTSNGLAMSEDYNVSNVTPSLSLPNADSTVTYTVEVTNIGNAVMGIASMSGCPSNLVCEVTNYQMTEPICDDNNSSKCSLGAVKHFNITVKYASGGYNSSNTSYDLVLRFDFRGFHNVTYVNAPRGNNYKTYAMDNINFIQAYDPAGGLSASNGSGTLSEGTHYSLSNKTITVNSSSVVSDLTIRFKPLGEYINKLYADGSKSTVSNGGTIGSSGYTYNRVTSLGLINDREGGRVDPDSGNVRYYGTSSNNYIYYNCSDYSNQSDSTCEKWRIIGVFNGKVKIIRNSSIGGFSFDIKKNKWVDSALHRLLNSGYEGESVNNSLYWNAESGKCYTGTTFPTSQGYYQEIDCDFTSTGLKSGDTKDFITTETIYFTSPTSALVNVGNLYHNEHGNGSIYRENDRTWTGKVSLPYPSDYYYSTDLSTCTSNVFWLSSDCAVTSWMTQNADMWTITPGPSGDDNVWYIKSTSGARYTIIPTANAILPTLYMYENTIFIDGDGSSGNPYKIYPLA